MCATFIHCSRATQLFAPAAAFYEQGRVHRAGAFAEREIRMCNFDGEEKSPAHGCAGLGAGRFVFAQAGGEPERATGEITCLRYSKGMFLRVACTRMSGASAMVAEKSPKPL